MKDNLPATLDQRQLHILRLLALNCPRKAIADDLGVSLKTVEFHINGTENKKSLSRVTGCKTLAEMVRYATEKGIVKPGEVYMEKPKPTAAAADKVIKNTDDLLVALLDGASKAASGKADALQVGALCQCSDAIIRLARLQLEVSASKSLKVLATITLLMFCFSIQAQNVSVVSLAWDAPTNSPTPIAGYKLYWGTASSNYVWFASAGTNTQYTITAGSPEAITNGATYYFAATDMDTNGLESAFSNEVIYTPPAAKVSPVILLRSP